MVSLKRRLNATWNRAHRWHEEWRFQQLLLLQYPSLIPPGCSLETHGYVPGQQFPGNRIDPSCFSPISQKLLELIPHANNPRTPNPNQNNNFTGVSSFPTREFEPGFSIDRNLTETQKTHGSYW